VYETRTADDEESIVINCELLNDETHDNGTTTGEDHDVGTTTVLGTETNEDAGTLVITERGTVITTLEGIDTGTLL
jgi:hypothetical protein